MLTEVQQLGEDAAKLAATAVWPLSDDELTACLHAAHRWQQAAEVLQTRLINHAVRRGIPTRQGHRTTTSWLRSHLRLNPAPARELAEHAVVLSRQPALEQAVLQGRLDIRQAAVIAATAEQVASGLAELRMTDATNQPANCGTDHPAIDPEADDAADLGDAAEWGCASGPGCATGADCTEGSSCTAEVNCAGGAGCVARAAGVAAAAAAADDSIVHEAESTLIDMAARLPAYQLRRAGERILAHVAPHLADRVDAAALARQEARAHHARGFTLSSPIAGMVRVSGLLGLEDAALVHAALDPLCTPTPDDERRPAQRRADALTEVCQLALRTGELPATGGEPAQLAVTVAYDPLTRTLGPATTDTGTRLSPATARRLACDARILPAVLGSTGQVLDLGRAHRLATGPLRRALSLRDHGCAFPDCDRPPRWTDAHHIDAWTAGGATALNNLVLLCRRHHRLIHHPTAGWQIRLGPDGRPDFIPPPHVDPKRHPRRNLYHPRL